MTRILACLMLASGLGRTGTLFCGAYPDWVLVIDEASGKVTDRIHMETGLPRSLRLSADRKTIYVSTNDHNGFEVIDVATHQVTNRFVLDDPTHRYRVNGGAPDPAGKLLYASTTEIVKQPDRYTIGKANYTIIDMAQQKITKTVEEPMDSASGRGAPAGGAGGAPGGAGSRTGAAGGAGGGGGGGGGRGGGGFEVSPDGKYLYVFGPKVTVLNASDLSVVERIDLELPEGMPTENLGLGGLVEALSQPDQRVSLFNYSDPIVHNRVFGVARFDLNTRKFDFTPLGPAPATLGQLHITPDQKMGYTVSVQGTGGNRRCEFWGIDLTNTRLARTGEVPCRSRYSFGLSADGTKLYMYGAGFEIDVYSAATFQHEATWDLGNDMTGSMVILP